MKSAIISDVHSNLQALRACVEHAWEQGVERFVCLGDCVGYGGEPVATLELLRSLPGLITVCGNHDQSLIGDKDPASASAMQAAIDWTRRQLSREDLGFIRALPEVVHEDSVTFVHASAATPENWTYIRYPKEIQACMNAAGTRLTFIGHVHVPSVFYETVTGTIRELTPRAGVPIPLSPRQRYVVNVGSVGQPRDGNGAACFAVYDNTANQVTFHRVAYDYFAAARKIRDAGLPEFFAERLAMGR